MSRSRERYQATDIGRRCLARGHDPGSAYAVRAAVAMVAGAMLVGCGGQAQLINPDQRSTTPLAGTQRPAAIASASPQPATPSLGEIVWVSASDPETNAPVEIVTDYQPDAPRITASSQAAALPAGATIAGEWKYNDTSLDAFTTQVVTGEPTDRTWISFHLDRESATPWPTGVYEVSISVDGKHAQRATVEVTGQD